MNATLSTTAWVLHDLGLATSVGGTVFGKSGLLTAVKAKGARQNKSGELVTEAWNEFTPINLLSHVAVGLTWAVGRSFLSGREVGRGTRKLVLAKDVLTGVYVLSGIGSSAAGYGSTQLRDGNTSPVTETIKDTIAKGQSNAKLAKKLQRASTFLGTTNAIAGASLIALTAVLAMQSGRSARWSLLSHFLP